MSMSRRCLASAWRRAAAAACTTGRSDVARAALQDVRNAAGTSGGTARWSQVRARSQSRAQCSRLSRKQVLEVSEGSCCYR